MNTPGRSIVDEARDPGRAMTRSSLLAASLMNHQPARLLKNSQNRQSQSQLGPNTATTEFEKDEFWPLSGKPYCHVLMTKSHIKPSYHMIFPVKLHYALPGETVPAVVTYGKKSYNTTFYGSGKHKRFDIVSWKSFVIENSLAVGDALVFEVLDSSNEELKFRVQILRGDFPSELLERVNGQTSKAPIVLD